MDEHTQGGTTSREEEGNVDGLRPWSDTTMVIRYGAGWHRCSRGVQANLDQKQRQNSLEEQGINCDWRQPTPQATEACMIHS